MTNHKKRATIVGILGGGQLARMTAVAAYKLGLSVAILDPEPDSPAQQLANHRIVGSLNDASALEDLAKVSDLITLENEFVDAPLLQQLESQGVTVYPTARTVALIQDKLFQKETLQANGIAVPAFLSVSKSGDLMAAAEKLGWPMVIKARRNGYDGRGNVLIEGAAQADTAWKTLRGEEQALMVEGFVNFKKELAVMAARSPSGEIVTYPVVETIQENHICHIVKSPAEVAAEVSLKASDMAKQAVEAIGGIGIFGIEMFLLEDDRIEINELAPRPHNSGHYTIEACITSQFENHLRAILGLPLGSTSMVRPAAVMVNLLGQRKAVSAVSGVEQALQIPGVNLHIYGKKLSRPSRKMGHITVLGDTVDDALERALKGASSISF